MYFETQTPEDTLAPYLGSSVTTHAFKIVPEDIETITPSHKRPESSKPYTAIITKSKDKAIEQHNVVNVGTKIYTDGLGIDSNMGATAVLYNHNHTPCILKHHLGLATDHTIYEAEAVGLTLAVQLLLTEEDVEFPIHIFTNNQAVIKSGDLFSTKPDHYLIDEFTSLILWVRKNNNRGKKDIRIHWIASHEGVEGNEKVDEEAKAAAQSAVHTSPKAQLPLYLHNHPLPKSISAQLQLQHSQGKERWQRLWAHSLCHKYTNKLDPKLLSRSFQTLTVGLSKCHTCLLI